ncbi:MAG: DNA methyltransferase, partial [Bacteroidales bacterium]
MNKDLNSENVWSEVVRLETTDLETNVIYNEDCMGKNGMQRLPDNSIDMILADLPYGTTACKWDSIIPLKPLWKQYKRIIKDDGVIVLTASQPFTTKLISSNMEWFRYEWIWIKDKPGNFMLAKKQPLKHHENICVFYNKQPTYNPQMEKRLEKNKRNNKPRKNISNIQDAKWFCQQSKGNDDFIFPKSYQKFNKERNKEEHPTQKPVALFEYL